jgi:tetratricopeptide (TPR) repeat protein
MYRVALLHRKSDNLGIVVIQVHQKGHPETGAARALIPNDSAESAPSKEDIDAIIKQGFDDYDKGDYHGAIANFTKAIAFEPDNFVLYMRRGLSYDKIKEYDKAISDYTEAININPNYENIFATYNNRGYAYYGKNDYSHAFADYTKAISINPNYARAYRNRGQAYLDTHDYNIAMDDFNEAIKLAPDDPDHYFLRGLCYYYSNDYAHARSDWEKTLQLDPNNTDARNNLNVLKNQGH